MKVKNQEVVVVNNLGQPLFSVPSRSTFPDVYMPCDQLYRRIQTLHPYSLLYHSLFTYFNLPDSAQFLSMYLTKCS